MFRLRPMFENRAGQDRVQCVDLALNAAAIGDVDERILRRREYIAGAIMSARRKCTKLSPSVIALGM